MKLLSFILVFWGTAFFSVAQDTKIVFLKEDTKQIQTEDITSQFSQKSLERRAKHKVLADQYDVPVNKEILSRLAEDGEILSVSKWLNALTFKTTLTTSELKEKYDFIDRIQTVHTSTKPRNDKFKVESGTKSVDYGAAAVQIEQLKIDCLHEQGYTGEGVYVGVIDAGFNNMDSVGYFDSVYLEGRVIETYNFVNTGQTVYDFSGHGTAVASCIVGEGSNPDQYIGAAVDVDLALYLSEDVSSETEIEEFYLVQALERADSMGVELVNISLGYFGFDDSTTSHVYADLDGTTTIAAIGVNVAKSKGIFVSMAAGNSGPLNISTPCDATGGFCVGAVTSGGDYAWFSSVGPTADGRVKPDVMARGGDAWFVNTLDSLGQGNGTSLATPIVCGGVACLMQAHPTKTVDEIMIAVRESASLFTTPNDSMGYGIPDFCLANDILAGNVSVPGLDEALLSIYPNPTTADLQVTGLNNEEVELLIYDNLGKIVLEENGKAKNGKLTVDLSPLSNGVYNLFLYQSGTQVHRKVSVSK